MDKYTTKDFERDFPSDDSCLDFLKNLRWPNGIECQRCQTVTKHHKITGRPAYACDRCGTHVYPAVATILQDSHVPLRHWFHAMFLMGATRCGISAKQLEREIGVNYKTAWRMFRQIRFMMDDDVMSLLGEVEIDESYFGGKDTNRHESKKSHARGRGAGGKTPVFGMAQRKGKVVATVVSDVSAKTLLPKVREKVLPRSVVYSDEYAVYNPLASMGYRHERVHHAAKVYVQGTAHTNTIEGFWSLVKRGISGVNHAVSAKHLQSYVNAYAFRWNHRNDVAPMFQTLLHRLVPPAAQAE